MSYDKADSDSGFDELDVDQDVAESSDIYPLPDDYPILTRKNDQGEVDVLVTYGQPKWNFSSVAGKIFNFYFYPHNKNARGLISERNWAALKVLTAYLWIEHRSVLSLETIHYYYKQIRALLVICTSKGVEVQKSPLQGKECFEAFTEHNRGDDALRIATMFYYARDKLGFYIVSPYEAALVQKYLGSNEYSQTPYIPKRIYDYQVDRLYEFLNEFIVNIENFKLLFRRLEAVYRYSKYSRRDKGRVSSSTHNISPFRQVFMSFLHYSVYSKVDGIIERWMVPQGKEFRDIVGKDSARILSSYCTAICHAGLLYLANFSGMRKKELSALAAKCLRKEHDSELGWIYFLTGPTTKTISDSEALWVTDEYSEQVVQALTVISDMRVGFAKQYNRGVVTDADIENPLLLVRAYEPWGRARGEALDLSVSLTKDFGYSDWSVYCPNLFDESELKITEEDFKEAKFYTPTLDVEQYKVGSVWSFSLHQLRRTLLVRAVEHGVSLNSVQYQAKHKSRGMSVYYTRKNKGLKLSKEMTKAFMIEIGNHLSRTAQKLPESNFVSIYGESHKAKLIEFIKVRDITTLDKDAKNGTFAVKETFYGVCLRKSFCSSGGISYIGDCPDCTDGLGDVEKLPMMKILRADLSSQLSDMVEGELDYLAVQHQIAVVDRAINLLNERR